MILQYPGLQLADVIGAVAEQDERAMSLEDRAIALLLVSAWAIRTGRVLRPVPFNELTAEELVNFWADDQLEEPPATSVPG
jgi:hypothetical protein